MIRWLPLLLLAACAPRAGFIAEPPQITGSISYATTRCFGTCPDYMVEIDSYGGAVFTGRAFTAVIGERRFPYSWRQWEAFTRALESAKPGGAFTGELPPMRERRIIPDTPECASETTDMPTIEVVWRDGTQPMRETRLTVYLGCDMEKNRALFDTLRRAPEALAIGDLIGRPGQVRRRRPGEVGLDPVRAR